MAPSLTTPVKLNRSLYSWLGCLFWIKYDGVSCFLEDRLLFLLTSNKFVMAFWRCANVVDIGLNSLLPGWRKHLGTRSLMHRWTLLSYAIITSFILQICVLFGSWFCHVALIIWLDLCGRNLSRIDLIILLCSIDAVQVEVLQSIRCQIATHKNRKF